MSEQETGDVNADGIADLVVTRLAFPLAYATFPIGVFLGDGRGGFRDGSSLFVGPIPRTQHGRQIVIADFNGDRRNDIFVADHGYDAEPFPGRANTLVLSTADGKLVDASGNMPPESVQPLGGGCRRRPRRRCRHLRRKHLLRRSDAARDPSQ